MKLQHQHYAMGAFLVLTIASLWERKALPPAIFFFILFAALARKESRP